MQLSAFLLRYNDLSGILEIYMPIIFGVFVIIFWVKTIKNKIWETHLKALLMTSLTIILSTVLVYLISFLILGGSLSGLKTDNLGQMVSLFILFAYLIIMGLSYLIAQIAIHIDKRTNFSSNP